MKKLIMSSLPKTWILDLDGTIVRHNGYRDDGQDTLLAGAKNFLDSIGKDDMIIFITSRTKDCAEKTESFLRDNDIHYDSIVYEAPYGERILINDDKPSGLCMAYAFRKKRNSGRFLKILEDKEL